MRLLRFRHSRESNLSFVKSRTPSAPNPHFPVELSGFSPHAPFLKERRTRGPVPWSVQEIRGISLVFREMWDTTALDRKPFEIPKATKFQQSHQRFLKDQLERKLNLPRRRRRCSAADSSCAVAQLAHAVRVERYGRARLAKRWSIE
jgi:hypothetical protein